MKRTLAIAAIALSASVSAYAGDLSLPQPSFKPYYAPIVSQPVTGNETVSRSQLPQPSFKEGGDLDRATVVAAPDAEKTRIARKSLPQPSFNDNAAI